MAGAPVAGLYVSLVTERQARHSPRRDAVVIMLSREAVNRLRAAKRSDLAWIVLGGGGLAAYGAAILVRAFEAHAGWIASRPGMLLTAVGALSALTGLLSGGAAIRVSASRAYAPWTWALPISDRERRRMAVAAASAIGGIGLSLWACAVALVLWRIAALHWPVAFVAIVCTSGGFRVGLGTVRWKIDGTEAGRAPDPGRWDLSIGRLDRWPPAWLSSWSWRLPAGRLKPGIGLLLTLATFGAIGSVAAAASVLRGDAEPAAAVGVAGGVVIFVMSFRTAPLRSPILRSSPTSFTRAWLRLMALPFATSAGYVALLAGIGAAAADAWAEPAQRAVEWAALSLLYGAFAACFTAPWVSALAFTAAIADAAYEALEYGWPIYGVPLILAAWLWLRARRRYRRG